jgi:hypothetical protein
MTGGVVHQVAEGAGELVCGAGDHHHLVVGRRVNEVHRDPAGSSSLRHRERSEVHGSCRRSDRAVLVVGGEQQHVLEAGFESGLLSEQVVDHCWPVGTLGLESGHLENGADRGDGAGQLVGGVGHELPLPYRAGVQAAEHGVHGAIPLANTSSASRLGPGYGVQRGRRRHLVAPHQLVALDPSSAHSGTPITTEPWSGRLLVIELPDVTAGNEGVEVTFPDSKVGGPAMARRFMQLHDDAIGGVTPRTRERCRRLPSRPGPILTGPKRRTDEAARPERHSAATRRPAEACTQR